MMPQQSKRRLGRGLAALIGDDAGEEAIVRDTRALKHVPIEHLEANPNNPRKQFKEEDLEELARSIRDKGLLQPIVVRPRGEGSTFEIVAGERRWRAAQRAGVHDVPVLVRELSDGEALEVALIENIQRSDLNALEEARGYTQLLEQFNYTQQQLADSLGKSRSHIANTLRLLTLARQRARADRGRIADRRPRAGADRRSEPGRACRSDHQARPQCTRSREAVTGEVRPAGEAGAAAGRAVLMPTSGRWRSQLLDATGLKVEIADHPGKGGKLTLHYKTLEQLDGLCRRLGVAPG